MATLKWNRWQHSSGIGGNVEPEYARKEAGHLRYSESTLFNLTIDLEWVKSLNTKPELAEKVEAFVSRFGRLQDHLGEKLLPRFANLVGENTKTLLDTLDFAEKVGVLDSVDAFIVARKLRNTLVHEYMYDAQVFLESLLAAQQACYLFFSVIEKTELEINHLGVQK